jgi:hypothetical protein
MFMEGGAFKLLNKIFLLVQENEKSGWLDQYPIAKKVT